MQFLPPLLLLAWMREGINPKRLRHCADLPGYVFAIYAVSTGLAWMLFAVIHLMSKWIFHPWMNDHPDAASLLMAALTVGIGLFAYGRLLGLPVMKNRRPAAWVL